MFNWFFNWLDPKILNMEKWVNVKVAQPAMLDIDLDKVKKTEVRPTEMFNKSIPTKEGCEAVGPFIVNLQNAKLMSLVFGPGEVEAFGLYEHKDQLWWRHRDGGTTHDFRVAAFDDMQEFVAFIDDDINFWECVLRTEARLSEAKEPFNGMKVSEVKDYISEYE